MAIRIKKGPSNGSSPLLSFLGVSVDGNSASSQFNLITNILAQVNSQDNTRVDIVNLDLTAQNGTQILELASVSFDDWLGDQNETFTTAQEVVDYINIEVIAQTIAKLEIVTNTATANSGIVTVGAGVTFSYKANGTGGIAYYWNELDFPPGVWVSTYDHRVISGVVTTPGNYIINYEIANQVGITSTVLDLVVT